MNLTIDSPKVSVIVPVYCVEQFIRQCAESLFSQTWDNLELIFVDNNTPDASIDILKEVLETSYPQMKSKTHIIREEKAGLGNARMAGIRIAAGDYLIHVDSDDWVEPDYIETLVTAAVEEGADVAYCDYYKEYVKKPHKVAHEPDLPDQSPATRLYAIHNSIMAAYMWDKLIRRSLYDLGSLVTPIRNMHEDLVFQTQLLYKANKMVHVRKPLYHYRRRRGGAITAGSWRKTRNASAESLLYLYESLPQSESPLDYCSQDLVMRAGWYALSTFHFKTLKACRKAVQFLSEMEYVKGRRVPVIKQRILRSYCRLLISLG